MAAKGNWTGRTQRCIRGSRKRNHGTVGIMTSEEQKERPTGPLEQTDRHTDPSQTTEVEGGFEEVVSRKIPKLDKKHKYKSKVIIII